METGIEDILYLTLRETNMTAQQLKNSILQMAVQGKLVPQDPNDEPASVLLERIRAEKEKLIKEGKIKKEKNPSVIFRGEDNLPYEKVGKNEPVCIADEIPFEIPESWEWVRCSTIGSMIRGKGIKRNETVEIGLPCVRYGEIYTTYDTEFTETSSYIPAEVDKNCNHFNYGDIIFTLTGENKPDIAKAVTYLGNKPVAAGGDLAYWTAHGMNPLFLMYYLNSPYSIEMKKHLATGDIIVHISTSKIGSFLLPIPPLEEQNRIVKKIKELIPHIKEYQEKLIVSENLSTHFPEMLKKSILQEAVMGKLVPQDPNDEPASVLLDRIHAEKQALIKAGKLKKDKHESIIYRRDNSHYEKLDGVERCIDDEIPYDIPDSWEWVRLGSLFVLLSGTDFKPEQYNDRGDGLPYITGASNLGNHGVIINRWMEFPQVIAERGDVLLVCKGSGYGRTMICNITSAHIARQIMAFKLMKSINMDYLICFLEANYDVLKSRGQGVIPGIDRRSVLSLLFPLPPLAEQGRIIAKAVQLTKLCNLL